MTTKPTPGNGQSAAQKKASANRNAIVSQIVDKVIERDERGRMVAKINDDQVSFALDRIAAGDGIRHVAAQLSVNRSYFHERAARDPEFASRLRMALEIGSYAIVENTINIASGGDLSSGSIERDKLMCDVAWKWGKTIGNRIFGDKLQVDQRKVVIVVPREGVNGNLADW